MDFTKLVCPVCGKRFNEDDDIVVCPVCGTPHHRECYNKNGKCINSDIHSEGYVYEKNDKTLLEKNFKDVREETADPKDGEEKDTEFNKEQEELKKIVYDINHSDRKEVKIDGKPSLLYEVATGVKSGYYIPRFIYFDRMDKKILFSFYAFLCPLAWAGYKRIYKLFAVILAFYVLIFSILYIPIARNEDLKNAAAVLYEQEGAEGMIKAYSFLDSDNATLTSAEADFLKAVENAATPKAVSITVRISIYVMRAVVAIFGTYMYFDATKKRINKICEKNQNLSEEKNLVMRDCRTSLGLAIVAAFLDILFFF